MRRLLALLIDDAQGPLCPEIAAARLAAVISNQGAMDPPPPAADGIAQDESSLVITAAEIGREGARRVLGGWQGQAWKERGPAVVKENCSPPVLDIVNALDPVIYAHIGGPPTGT